jgi:hypothetical protein
MLKNIVRGIRFQLLAPILAEMDRVGNVSLVLQGREAAHAWRGYDSLEHLSDAEFKVYSQWGEDGILEWLIQRLPISSQRFVEFGVQDYREANTRFLLLNRNWKGLVLDGSQSNIRSIRQQEIYWRHDLNAICAFVDRDNINRLISGAGLSGSLGVLSIDIDGNDYWIWDAIDVVDADIIVCEYNAVFGDLFPITVPYDSHFIRSAAHPSNLYYGASIQALCLMAQKKGYEHVGSNRAGNNAFFVRKELFPVVSRAIANLSSLPSVFRESRDANGKLSYLNGLDRLREIERMPVVHLETGATLPLSELGLLYSRKWLGAMGGA